MTIWPRKAAICAMKAASKTAKRPRPPNPAPAITKRTKTRNNWIPIRLESAVQPPLAALFLYRHPGESRDPADDEIVAIAAINPYIQEKLKENAMAAYQYIYVMKDLTKAYPGGKKVLENIYLSFYP